MELNASDRFSILNKEKLALQIGDTVKIAYNGEISESYLAQFGERYIKLRCWKKKQNLNKKRTEKEMRGNNL